MSGRATAPKITEREASPAPEPFVEGAEGIEVPEPELELANTRSEEAAPAAEGLKTSRTSENYLGRYFREMASLSVLKPEEELEAAQRIESLEVDLWRHLLGYASLVEPVLAVVEAELEEPVKGVATLRKLARSVRSQPNTSNRRRFEGQVQSLAKELFWADVDRRTMFAVLGELDKIEGGDHERVFQGKLNIRPSSKTYKQYMRDVNGRFSQAQRARNEFVKANLRLVVSIARRFNHGRMPLSDLIQEGNMGLIKAVERYDYRRGYRFSTYASWWIRHAISRALADKGRAVRLPVHMIDAYHKVARTRRELSSRLGRPPTTEEIAQESGIGWEKVRKLEGYLMESAVSLDREVSDEDGRRFIDMIEDEDAAQEAERLIYRTMNDQVSDMLSHLKPIEADILRKRFGLEGDRELTLKEIGEGYSLSRERIRQLQEQALGKIRRALDQ